MIRTGITNHPNFPIDEWQVRTVNLGELFEIPQNVTSGEIEFAKSLMEIFQIEQDDDEALLEIISKPSGFKSFLVNVKRIVEIHNKTSYF